jgi:glutamyl-tRNA synthetase
MVNFLALLGWSLDDRTEFFTVEELIKQFSIEHISKSSAVFDMDKLKWMNGTYIRALDLDVLTDCLMPFLDRGLPPTSVERPLDKNYVRQIVPLIRERITTLEEAVSACEFFFVDNNFVYDIKMLLGRNLTKEKASQGLTSTLIVLTNVVEYKSELLEDELRALADALEVKVSDFFGLLRVALTGRTVSPPLFQVMEVLGRERCIRRIVAASHYVGESISLDKEGK